MGGRGWWRRPGQSSDSVQRNGSHTRVRLIWGLIAAVGLLVAAIITSHQWWTWRVLATEYETVILLGGLFLLSNAALLPIELRRQTITFSIVEVPLVIGLFYAEPLAVLLARLIATTASNAYLRTPGIKFGLNVVAGAAEVAIALSVANSIGLGPYDDPQTWGTATLATIVAASASTVCVFSAISLAQGVPTRAEAVSMGVWTIGAAVLNAAIGLLVVLVLRLTPWSTVLLLLLLGATIVVYRSYTRFVRQQRRLVDLYEMTRALGEARQAGTLVDELLTRTRKLLQAESATLWLPAQGRFPETLLTARADATGLLDQTRTPDPARKLAVRDGRTVAVGPRVGDPDLQASLRAAGIKDEIVVPLRSGSAVIGCVEVADRLGDLEWFRREDVQLLETLAAHAAVAVENSRLVDRLRFDAYHDALTGLPNRRRMTMALEEAVKIKAPGEVVALLLFDVDGMRDVNDSLGHAAGDKLLIEVARRLTTLSPPGALVARVGGDEFVVMLRLPDGEAAVALAAETRAALQAPLSLGSLTLDVDTAAGIALHPDHGTEPETLLQRADLATYAAKSVSSAVRKFNLGMESRSVRRLGLAGDLRRALDADEIDVYFQPKVGLASRELVGVECLVRWEHPAHGSVAPEDFVAVAEHTGQLGRLTDVVMRAGLRRCRQWCDDGRPLSVAVNLSPRTLVDPEFPGRVEVMLAEYGVTPSRLTLEITEDGVLGETDRPLPTLHRLRDLGVRLSVDDFGTGYSSLSYLRRLPVHEVKVDRTFVQGMATDPGDLAIVRAVVDLSRHFGLDVVAEGVESELTLSLLEEMGCDIGQGFLFSRPLPYERLEAWFAAQTEPQTTPAGEVRRLRAVL